MDTYVAIETCQDIIKLENIIRSVCYLQDNNKQDIMAAVKTNKQVYLFCHYPYQYNGDYLEVFKAYLKVSQAYNRTVGYHPGLAIAVLL